MYNRYSTYKYYRSVEPLPSPVPIIPNPSHPTVEPNPSYIFKKTPTPQKKKIDFKSLKKNTCTSLNDVECFLNNFCSTLKYIKLIKLLK